MCNDILMSIRLLLQQKLSQRSSHVCFLRHSCGEIPDYQNSSRCDVTREVQAYPAFPWAEIALGISALPHLENSENYVEVTSRKPLI